MRQKKLLSFGQGGPVAAQIKKPCTDCPMRRDSIPGWLGGSTAQEYVQLAHSDAVVTCHVHGNCQCAGIAIYRKNVCKLAHPPNLVLPKDTERVFAWPTEFVEHHTLKPTAKDA